MIKTDRLTISTVIKYAYSLSIVAIALGSYLFLSTTTQALMIDPPSVVTKCIPENYEANPSDVSLCDYVVPDNPTALQSAVQCEVCYPGGDCDIVNGSCCARGYTLEDGQCVTLASVGEECQPQVFNTNSGVACSRAQSCTCPTDQEWNGCSCKSIDVPKPTLHQYASNLCFLQDNDTITVNREGAFCDSDGACYDYDDLPTIGGVRHFYSRVEEGSCYNFTSPKTTLYTNQANITNETNTTTSFAYPNLNLGGDYCITTIAQLRDLNLTNGRNIYSAPQQIHCIPTNAEPETPTLTISGGYTDGTNTYIGGSPETQNHFDVVAKDVNGLDDIEKITLAQWPRTEIQGASEDALLNIMYYPQTLNFYIVTPQNGQEFLGMNTGAPITYNGEYFELHEATVEDNGFDTYVIHYTITYKKPYPSELKIDNRDYFRTRTFDSTGNYAEGTTLFYIDNDPPLANVVFPSAATTYLKGSRPEEANSINLQWGSINDYQPSSGIPTGILQAAYVLPDNCTSSVCNDINGAIYEIATDSSNTNFDNYYELDASGSLSTDASVYRIPFEQVIAKNQPTSSSEADNFGGFEWTTSLNEPDVRIITAVNDNIGNYGTMKSTSFGIDSELPVVYPITSLDFTPSLGDVDNKVELVFPRSTDDVSDIDKYEIRRLHQRLVGTGLSPGELADESAYYYEFNPESLNPDKVTFDTGTNSYTFYDFNNNQNLDTIPPLSVHAYPTGDGSPTHDPDVPSEDTSLIVQWTMEPEQSDMYTYQVLTYDNAGWMDYSDGTTIQTGEEIVKYELQFEHILADQPFNPGSGDIVDTFIVNHTGLQDEDAIQSLTYNNLLNGAWYVHIVAIEGNGQRSQEEVLGPYIIGNVQPSVEFNSISGEVNDEIVEYMFTDEDDPTYPDRLIPTAHSTFKDYSISLSANSNTPGGSITNAEIVRINGQDVIAPNTYPFTGDDDTGIWTYNGLTFDTSLRYNRLLVKVTDNAGYSALREVVIEYIPPAHIDVRVTADVSSAFTESQINIDPALPDDDDRVKFTTTIFSPGAKGLSSSYYSDANWNVLNKNFLEDSFNHGTTEGYSKTYLRSGGGRSISTTNPYSARTTMSNYAGVGSTDDYSVKWEGRIRAPETGRYFFDIELGSGDYVEVKFDQNEPYKYDNSGKSHVLIKDTTLYGDGTGTPLQLQQGVWYGISVKYKGIYLPTGVDDAIRIKWRHEREGAETDCMPPIDVCTDNHFTDLKPITEEELTLNAGNITSIIDNYDVTVTMPEGFEYDENIDPSPVVSYVNSSGQVYTEDSDNPILLKPYEIDPIDISTDNAVQSLTWSFQTPDMISNNGVRFRTNIPVGESLQITHYARAVQTRLIGPEDKIQN